MNTQWLDLGLPVVTAVLALISVLFAKATSSFAARKTAVEFEVKERDLIGAVRRAVSEVPEGREITYRDLAEGNFRDDELREVVEELAARTRRLEAVSETLEVRRQALLETYHNQGLSQSKVSFAFSLVLGVLGFAVIVFAVLTKSEQVGTYMAGAITEAVAALFFTQSNQARRLMAEFFDKLRDDRRLEESLKLTENIRDDKLQSCMQALLSLQLINSTVSPSVLPGFAAGVNNDGDSR